MSFLSTMLSSTARTWNRDSASTTVMAAWDGREQPNGRPERPARARRSVPRVLNS